MTHIQVSARTGRRGAALTAGLALAASLVLTSPGGAAQAARAPAEECDPATGHSAARVTEGHGGVDPNSVTAAEAAALQAQLDDGAARLRAQGRLGPRGDALGDQTIRVKTYVHVITRKDGSGGVPTHRIRRQMQVLNAGYAGDTTRWSAPSPFRFELAGIDVTRNDRLYGWPLTDDLEETEYTRQAKRRLHRGGFQALNVYIVGFDNGLLGYATFPGGPLKLDGVVILNDSLPGGAAAPYNRGDTLTHEVGHWLALFHTFDNGCQPPGDQVDDTPYQRYGENIFSCGDWGGDGSTTRPDDTCPQPGKDPVHNFMSYGDDICLDRFTHGQQLRQVIAWFVFRDGR